MKNILITEKKLYQQKIINKINKKKFKIFKHLGWKSSTSIKKGLDKTFLWYLSNRDYFRSFKKKDIMRRIGKK